MFHSLYMTMADLPRDTQERFAEASRTASHRAGGRSASLAGFWRFVGAWLAGLLADSRDSFRTKDQDLANYGFRHCDPELDRPLAIELLARPRRWRGQGIYAAPPATSPSSENASRRWVGLVVFGQRPRLGAAE